MNLNSGAICSTLCPSDRARHCNFPLLFLNTIMLNTLKRLLRNTFYDTFVWDFRERGKAKTAIAAWQAAGKPVPPPEPVKRTTLADYGAAFGLETLIETGTLFGGTMYALRDQFKNLYSIELSPELAAKAQHRFRSTPQVQILQGDSGKLLPQLISGISQPCLFWLDGHYSGGVTAQGDLDTPILNEMRTIFAHPCKNHVILIDDARLFNGTDDYPTIDGLRAMCHAERPDYDFSVVNDIIRIHPARAVSTTY